MELSTADSVDEALDELSRRGERCRVLAGGTDVMIQLARREIAPEHLLHVERLGELRAVETDGSTRLGALVTHRDLAVGRLGPGYAAVAESAATVGGLQTQVVGTIGGNVCNASPAADTLPALLVHDAEVTLRSVRGAGPSRWPSSSSAGGSPRGRPTSCSPRSPWAGPHRAPGTSISRSAGAARWRWRSSGSRHG
ncbi:FAD binding domain-containing protein [Pseudonocardia benzenivorans]